jgi:valyl-tRNA synthetase
VPFDVVYMHGLVRDGQGKKMSKTTGNVIDPLETIDKFGCDALRYSLVTGSTPGQDIPLSMERIESNRNFANKLWNAARFVIGKELRLHRLGECRDQRGGEPCGTDEPAGQARQTEFSRALSRALSREFSREFSRVCRWWA